MMKIKLIEDYDDKQKIARQILEAHPDWFGIDEARKITSKKVQTNFSFAALDENQVTVFLCLKETSKDTLN